MIGRIAPLCVETVSRLDSGPAQMDIDVLEDLTQKLNLAT